jgi:hypothetical protein
LPALVRVHVCRRIRVCVYARMRVRVYARIRICMRVCIQGAYVYAYDQYKKHISLCIFV